MNKKNPAGIAAEADEGMSVEERRRFATQTAGSINAFRLSGRSSQIFELLAIRQVKDAEGHKALGLTWAEYCTDYLGRPVNSVDEDLQNLEVFGEEFMIAAERLSLGRAAMRTLRKIPESARPHLIDGGKAIELAGERIPLTDRATLVDVIEDLAARNVELRSNNEAGAAQLQERDDKIRELKKQLKREKPAKSSIPELVTEFDRYMINIMEALTDVLNRVKAQDAGTDPDNVKKYLNLMHERFRDILEAVTGYRADPDKYRPEGLTPELEREIDELLADDD